MQSFRSPSILATACLGVALFAMTPAAARGLEIEMRALAEDGPGRVLGTIRAEDSEYGTVFTPRLRDLPPGVHGFHLHANPSCATGDKEGHSVAGLAAGGHFDPSGSGVHAGPFGDGHLGDLPTLYADGKGTASQPVLAPRLELSDLTGKALMIHAGGDTYSDEPARLGGGGARVACGVIE